MKLITKDLIKKFEDVGSQEGNPDPIVIMKIFNPTGAGTWYCTELHNQSLFFGFVTMGDPDLAEWGYFGLWELQSMKIPPFWLGLERDLYFSPKPASQIPEIKRPWIDSDPIDFDPSEILNGGDPE